MSVDNLKHEEFTNILATDIYDSLSITLMSTVTPRIVMGDGEAMKGISYIQEFRKYQTTSTSYFRKEKLFIPLCEFYEIRYHTLRRSSRSRIWCNSIDLSKFELIRRYIPHSRHSLLPLAEAYSLKTSSIRLPNSFSRVVAALEKYDSQVE